MPATAYDYTTGDYTITCLGCGTTVTAARYAAFASDGLTRDDVPIDDTFRYVNRDGNFSTRCRSCERARRARRSTTRVPGTTPNALGAARRFGVELECGVPGHVTRDDIRAAFAQVGVTGWSIKGDGSLSIPGMVGTEVVSPPLSGEEGEEQVRKACRVLRELGATVNRTCGTHVHHDVNDLDVDAIKSVARGWFNNQNLIDGLVAPSRRPGGSVYCEPLRDNEMAAIDSAATLNDIRSLSIYRYRTLNLTSYGRYGTIEIRQHQGTLDAEKIISWTRLGQAIIDTAKVETSPLTTASRIRDFLVTGLGDRLNETARTFLLGRAVEFNAVAV